MRIGYSELITLDNDVEQNVRDLIAQGADSVELMMDGFGWDIPEEDYSKLAKQLKSYPIIYTLHPNANDTNLTAANPGIRKVSYEHFLRALDFAGELGAKQMVIHPGVSYFNKDKARYIASEAITKLADKAKEYSIPLAFENIAKSNSLYDEESFPHALDEVDPIVSYLIDIGHAHMNGWNVPKLIETLGPRLIGFHIHDNDGFGDLHLPIYKGTLSWKPIFEAMVKNCRDDVELILEYWTGTDLSTLSEGKKILIDEVTSKRN